MTKLTAAVMGGLFDRSGVSAYARPVLFGTAADALRAALPESVEQVYFVPGEGEAVPAGMEKIEGSGFAALQNIPDAEQVLVLTAPFVPQEGNALSRLVQLHLDAGYGVTVLAAEPSGFDADGDPRLPRATRAAIFQKDVLDRALAAAPDTFGRVIDAAVETGAQRGVVATGALIEIRDGVSAYQAQEKMMQHVNFARIAQGVQIFDPAHTYIAPDAVIGAGTVILPGCLIRPGCRIGSGATIGPNTVLDKATIGDGTSVNSSQVYESAVGKHATVGPFAYIRPQCTVGDHTRIGDFVELKKAVIGNGTKVSHLTYIGDATVGERVNFGCGTVVVNYDGYQKTQTIIGDDCFIGCNTNLVSPVTLGDRVFTAAGTTVTKNVPDGALAVARARQQTFEGWNDKRRAAHEKK